MSDMTVVELSGQAWVRDENGNLQEVQQGDVIDSSQTVVTADNASLTLSSPDGQTVQVPEGAEVTLTSVLEAAEEEVESSDEDSGDDDSDSEESESSNEGGEAEESQGEGPERSQSDDHPDHEGQNFTRVNRIEEAVDPLDYEYGLDSNDGPDVRWGGAAEEDEEDEEDNTSDVTQSLREAPGVSVELQGAGDDGTYSQDEIGEDGSVTAQVTLEDGTEVGDTLTVTDKDGNVLDEREVTQDDLDNGVSVEVPVEPGDPETSVSATVTDPTGNSSSDDDQKPIDNVPPAVSVELTGSGEDGTYNQDEIGEDGSVTAQVTLEDGTEVGDTLTVTDKDGNVLDEREVTQDDLDNGVSVEVPVEPGDPDTSVSATVTDPTGNASSDDDQKPIDNVPPAVSAELTGSGEDGTYSQDEIGEDGSVTAQVTLEDGTEVGDTLTVTDKDGNVLDDREVTQDDLDNGVSVEVPVEPGDPNTSVSATVTDPTGNSSSDDDQKPIDNVPPAVSVELQGAGDDDTYSQDEIGDDGSVTAQVTLEDGTEVGDTLTVTDKDGNVLDEREVTQDDLDNGVSVEVPVEPGDPDVSVSATVTDPTGNSSSDDDQKPIDNVPPAVSVELTGSGEDGTYSQDEIGEDGSVTAQVTLEDGTEVGDTLTVTDKDGNVLDEREVTQDDLDNGVSVEVPVSPGDPNTSVSATVTDPTGNSSSDDDQKPIDNVPPAVSVELTGSGEDGTYSQDEIGEDGSVTAQVTLEDGTEVGDTLTVTDKDGNVLDEREVTQDDLDNGVSVEVPVEPGDPETSVSATVTDPTGNSSSDDDQKPIDNVPPAVSVELTGSGDDGTYSQDEIGDDGSVTAEVTLEDGTEVGDTLTVTDKDGNVLDERDVTQDDLDNGVTVEVPVEPGDPDVSVSATVTDPTGNSSSDDDQKPIDNVPPAVSVELTGSGDDGNYSQDEIGDDGSVTAEVTLEDGTEVGDTLTVTDKDGNVLDEREVTQGDLDNGVSVEVPVEPGDPDVSVNAKVTDPTGNSDSDDDSKPVDWNVTVNVPNDTAATTPDGDTSDQVVFESGLSDGSNPNADDTQVASSFTLTALDGLQETGAVTLDYTDASGDPATLELSRDEVEALGSDSQTLTTQYGELTLDGYSQADDGTITLDYDYVLTNAPDADVDDLMDSVTVTATDEDGSTDSGDLNIKIVDDAPVAEDDANSVTEDTATTTTGNVLGESGASAGDQADTEGADGATVTAVESTNAPTNDADETGGTLTIDGEYGTLTLEADGSYTYVLDNDNLEVQGLSDGETLDEVFSYTLTDGDSDADDANLTIAIEGSDDGVTVDVPNDNDSTTPDGEIGDQVVFESGLGDGSAPDENDTKVESSFTLTALDGLQETGAVTLDYSDENGESATLSLSKAEVEALGDTSQSLNTQYGELTVNGYSQADDGTISLDYDYLLTNAPDASGDDLMDSITVTATDEDGSTDNGDLNIKIVDDAPTAEGDTNSVTEGDDTASTVEASGNVIGGGDASPGDAEDTEGADGATVTAVGSVNTPDSEATETDGTLVIEGEYGTLTIEAGGSYTYALDNTNLDVQRLGDGDTLTEAFTYTLTDGDTDSDDATLTITIDGSDDGVTVDVPNDNDATTPDGNINDQVVFESGLTDGSAPNTADTRVESSFTLTALDGLQDNGAVSLTYTNEDGEEATLELSKAEVEALGDTSQTLTTEYGELTLNGYSQPDDGTISLDYDYLLSNAPDVDTDAEQDSFTITATDRDGQNDSGDLNIKIVDDAPVAEDDTNSVTEDSATTTTTGNVLGDSGASGGDVADDEGADGATVTAVTSTNVPANDADEAGGALTIDGEYGTLTLEADGSYSYVLDNDNLEVQGLSDGETLDEVFSYTLTDGDTDQDDANLTIAIDGSDDGVTVNVPNDNDSTTPDGEIGDQVVFESGLTDGSEPNADDIRVESSFTLTALDGLQETGAVTLDYSDENGESATLSLSKAEVETLGDTSQTLTTQYGELTLNGYSQADDGTITLDYDYFLTNAPEEDVDDLMDRVTVTATDEDGSTDSGDLNIQVVDDAPTAEDDTNSVTEGGDTASTVETSGNVIGGGDASPGDAEDTEGADGAMVTAAESTNVPGNSASGTDTLVIDGEYGTLTLEADGSYTYALDNTNLDVQGLGDGETLEEAFTYTLTDGDSDADNANLTITIDGSDDGVTVDVPNDNDATTPDGDTSDQVVFESGLADGSEPNTDDIRVESSFTLTALDGLQEMGAVTLGYTDENGESATLSLSKAEVEGLGDTSQSLSTQYGELTLDGYSQAADGTITLDYDYLLTNAPEEDVEDLLDSVTVTATDEDGSTDSGDLNIQIVDDAPVAEDDTNSVTEDSAPTTTTGNVLGESGASGGDVEDTEGADGATVTAVESTNVPGNSASGSGPLVIDGEYGTLTLEADGSYTYALDNTNLEVQGLGDSDTLTEAFTYTLTDGDTDQDDATLTITIDGSDDGVTVDVPNDNDATTPDGNINDQVVFESGLSDGSNPNADDTQVASSFTLTALDGLQETGAVTLDYTDANGESATLELSRDEVEALGDTSQTLTTQYGELTLNGYNQADDGTITLDYSYDLTNAPGEDVDDLMDSVTVTATDRDGQTDSGDLNIKIVDDAPTAEDDTNSVTEGAALNVDAASGVLENDQSGADDWQTSGGVVGVVAGDNGGAAVSGDVGTGIDGQYGTLTLNADGSYTYQTDPNSTGADVEDVFTYTVRDGDGDESTATLTIDVDDVTGTPTDTTGSVDEAGLGPNALPDDGPNGTDPSAESEIISGASLDLQDGWTVESEQSDSASLGEWTVYTDGTFDYTLTDDADHSAGAAPTDSFEYTAVDQYGNTVTNTVTIDIVDDQPVISVDNGQLGSVEVDESDFSGDEVSDEDLSFIDGVFDINHGADGEGSTTYSLQVTEGAESGITDTATDKDVHLFMDGDDVVGRVGNDADGDIAFRIALDGDAVTLTQYRPLEHPDGTDHDDEISLSNGALQLIATAVDGDGDSVDSEAVDVGGKFTFRDDGPSIMTHPTDGSVDEANLALGSDPDAPVSVSNDFVVNFGTDGAGDVQFSEGGVDSTVSALQAAGLESGGQALEYVVSDDGHTLTGYRGDDRSESGKVFTVDITNPTATEPGYEFTLHRPLDHDGGAETLDINLQHLTVTDGDNDTVETGVTITVEDDDPSVEPKAITVEEDSDVDSSENTFNTNADATGTNTDIDGGTPDAEGWVETTYGKAKVNDDGTITYEPNENYSGEDSFTYTTTTDNETKTFTVNVTVNPVADAPDLAGGSVTTPEDTPVALNLTAPSPVDTDDQNGSGTAGDNPELLGEITLSGIPSGTELSAAELDGNGAISYTSDGSDITIVLSDGEHTASAAGDLTMTTAQYEALQVNPIAQSHENFTIDLRVTSYEVDDTGNKLPDVDGAESTSQVDVGVQAVTDDVDLTIDGGDTHTASIKEDASVDLGDLLVASFEDLDGSEERSLEITGVPEGTSVTIDGDGSNTITITAGADGTIVIPASDLGSFGAGESTTIPASLALTPPADFSGDLDGITVTLKAQDHDDDSSGTVDPKEDSVTLNIDTAPVADQPSDISAEGPEDTDIGFLTDLAVSDTDGSESITTITVEGNSVPADWTIFDHEGNEVAADGSGNYAIDVDNYQEYDIRPAAHSSEDASLSLQVTVEDTASTGSDTQTHNVTSDITVTPDAEEVGGDSDGDGDPDLTMNPDHTYGTDVDGTEDAWFALNADSFNPADGWANQDVDGSEETFALLTPELVSGQGDGAEGSSFRYQDGSGDWVEQTYNGSPIEVPVEYLGTLQFKAAPNQKGQFEITVQAKTVDTDAEGNTDTAISGESTLDGIHIDTPVADQASMSVTSPAEGNEDEAIPLDIRPQSSDPNESFTVTISDVPDGAVLTYDGNPVTDDGNGNYVIEDFDSSLDLTVTPPQDSNEDFTLSASVVTRDEYDGEADTLDSPVTKPIEVPVNGVADEPDVTIDTPVYAEEDLDDDNSDANSGVTLSEIITAESGETGDDGSETLTYRITGLDDQFDVEGATLIRGEGGSREWVATDPSTVTITTPENFSGQVDFSVTPIVTENDGDTREDAEQNVSFQVTPSPEAEFSIQSSLSEDQVGQLNLSLEPQNGDNNESLASVWIDVASVTGNQFELYYGDDGTTTLADAAADGGITGVVEEGGYYKLTDDAWTNIYAKGDADVSGPAGTLEVRYEVTDTPNNGYEGSVDDTTVVKNKTHEVVIDAVTDEPTVTITGIANVGGSDATIDDPAKDVTADGNDSVAVTVDITQPDTDGSESLKYLLIDNVPAGVSVVDGEFVGQVADGTGSQWRIDIDPDVAFDGTDPLTQTVEFTMGDGDLTDIDGQNITITGFTQDNGDTSQEKSDSDSWTLTGEGNPGNGEDPSEIIGWNDANATMTEDTGMALSELVDAEIGDTSDGRSAVTISNLPTGAVVDGMQQTTITTDGVTETVWYASTDDSSNQGLQDLLDGITVTPPADWNDNEESFSFDTTLTTQSPSGEENSETISLEPPVTPVTDEPTVEVSGDDAADGEDVDFTIDVSSPADNPDVSLVDGQLVITLDENGMTGGDGESGTLWYNGEEVTPEGDGSYVIDGVDVGDAVNVSYRSADNTWGSVSLTAETATQENGASNEETSSGSSASEIAPPPPEVTASDATGSEDEMVELQDLGVTLPDDSQQSLDALLLENVPDGWLVKTGSDANNTALADNVGGNSWSILDDDGSVPDYIGLVPPRNWSGTLDGDDALTLTARTTQGGESTNASTDFEVDVQAVADDITMSPELSFGQEGDKIPLNLSAGMSDMDGSETATLTLTGLGEHAGFFTDGGDTLLDSLPDASVSYDGGSDTYTLSGIASDQINDLHLVQGATDGNQSVSYEAFTTDGSDTSETVSGDFNVNIEAVEPTSGDDTLLYTGEALDGLAGADVVEMRFGEDPTPDDLDNVETLDFMGEDQDHSVALEAQDVLDMTDEDNVLSILGDDGDSVDLTGGSWTTTGETQTEDNVTYQLYNGPDDEATLKVQQDVSVDI
ncbi:VCBS domain-containing protein [Halomonas sabkhae]|uniref:VCBS domain-containing protein n=1 Tax=Halomonas sabkhae TaxID=626223 RepID=UPI0025B42CCD|nr:VCBS domain-containing protein [Halomonas sabkhae]MDN3526242.1 VCBS domain-containing protein [Halomonas sabkhae]